MNFDITEEQAGDGVVIVRLTGQLDFTHVAAARSAITRSIDQGATLIVANLDGLDYIDSAGLGVLVGTLARLRERNGELAIVCHSPRIRRVFAITKLTQLLEMYEDEPSALKQRN